MHIKKNIKKIVFGFLTLPLFLGAILFVGKPVQTKEITWGVNFSQKHSELLGLNWRENYLALLDDLKVKNIKIITHWDLIEAKKDEYFFEDLDWQINESEKRERNIIFVIGIKTGRWPECHIPAWARNLSKEEQQKEILEILEKIVLRYRRSSSLIFWQVENEPFFPFGECPDIDENFLKKEIELVKFLDPTRSVIFTDSGEFSFWFKAAKFGDIVGTTLHRRVWFKELNRYLNYPFRPVYYWRKSQLIKKLFHKKVICVELQAEPWGPKLLYDLPLKEQEKTMDLAQFKENIEFAKKTGLDTFYFWGLEWWYWLKVKKDRPEIWLEAKKLF